MITSEASGEFELPDLLAMELFGAAIALALTPGLCIYLNGDLGCGKTTLVRYILKRLGYKGHIKSPTYTLVETYNFTNFNILHFDLYRVQSADELENIGIRDFGSEDTVLLFEWASNGHGIIPPADLEINLHFKTEGRYAICVANSAAGKEVLNSIS